ncbi:hypothetical protein ACU8V7_27935 [Zobellia nedashkovskayae]
MEIGAVLESMAVPEYPFFFLRNYSIYGTSWLKWSRFSQLRYPELLFLVDKECPDLKSQYFQKKSFLVIALMPFTFQEIIFISYIFF